jgi:hypothetical protein
MSKEIIIVSIILAMILMVGSGVYLITGPKKQLAGLKTTITEKPSSSNNDLWKETKIYKSNTFGFSIEYPKSWELNDYSRRVGNIGGLLFELGKPYEASIDCFTETDLAIFIGKEKYEKLSKEIDKLKFMMELDGIENLKIKKKIQVPGGNVYVIRGKSTTGGYGIIGKEYDYATFYNKLRNSIVILIPRKISGKDYIKILGRIKILTDQEL